jgi:TolB-like protein/tetratricopeptide (TPR) repeat protein/predicted Ser/Thr protein kinase
MIGQTLGHYRILEKIAAGGMGVVYRAHDEQLERDVALKVLPSGTITDTSSRRQFRKEALALAKLSHPNIETIYEFDTQDGIDFLVMEYVPGNTLAERLGSGALPEKEVVALGMQITAAMEEAHNCGIVHRDLKPRNIAITERGQAKVLDFGLAKLLPKVNEVTAADTLTDTQAGAGTLPYMPPEQLQGESVDARADIYTIGAVLYEMATDRRAFPEQLPSRVINAILHHPPVPPRALNSRISPELERIILKCLDKEPGRRFQSAKELSVDLCRLDGAPSNGVAPQPPPLRPNRTRWLVVYSLAALLAIPAALIALNFHGWRDDLMGRPRPAQVRSLAVLPFENLSGDPEQDYFADGMTDALINDLGQIAALRVISRTSVMAFKGAKRSLPDIARQLHVEAVAEGSVRRNEDKVQINVQLVQASTDVQLWGRSYEQDLRDILTLQNAVARAIADEIQIKLTPQEQAQLSRKDQVDPIAHEAYLTGRFYWNKRTPQGLQKSIDSLERAVSIDPKYAVAYAALAYSYHLLPELTSVPASEAFPKARTAALKALELDDSLAEAHTALGNVKEDYDWDWSGAEKEYKRAIELNPGYEIAHVWYSNLLLELGRLPEAIVEARTAQQLDPLSAFTNDNLAAMLYYAGEYDQAVQQCQNTLEIDPASHQAHRHLGQIYIQKRFYPEAISELKKAVDLSPGSTEALADLGYVLGVSGKKEEARQILVELENSSQHQSVSSYHLAIVHIGLGERELALQSLQKAVDDRSPGVVHLKVSPLLEGLRSDPRFEDLLVYTGLSRKP